MVSNTPSPIRTRVFELRVRRPGPLDEGGCDQKDFIYRLTRLLARSSVIAAISHDTRLTQWRVFVFLNGCPDASKNGPPRLALWMVRDQERSEQS